MNQVREIIFRIRQGENNQQIINGLGVSRNTVRRYRKMAQRHDLLAPDKPLLEVEELRRLLEPENKPALQESGVMKFNELVRLLLKQRLSIQLIWESLVDQGYQGSYSAVKRFVRKIEPRIQGMVRIETPPGKEAQVDFGYAGLQVDPRTRKKRKTWAFVMTLSWSRHPYVEFVFDQKTGTWLNCHEKAFQWFGGVPEEVVIDNLKSGVIQAEMTDPVLGEPYRRLARHYGFRIHACRPRTPEHKGKVESGVKYLKGNFLPRAVYADLDDMNQKVKVWIIETAGTRVHGTTREEPMKRFVEVEKKRLKPLPESAFELVKSFYGTVQQDCHVVAENRYYSVPHRLIGEKVEIYVGKIVEIYLKGELITTHEVVEKKGGRGTRPEHYPKEKLDYLLNPAEKCRERAKGVGPSCEMVVERRLSDKVQDRLKGVQLTLRLVDKHGREAVELSCTRALAYDDITYRRIKGIVKSGLYNLPLDKVAKTELVKYKYARPVKSFFEEAGS